MSFLKFLGLGRTPPKARDYREPPQVEVAPRAPASTAPPPWLEDVLKSGRTYRPTSRQAWESMIGPCAELDRAIMGAMASRADPGAGITCQEIETLTGRSHQSVSANLRHLVEDGLVEPTGAFGVTQSGRRAMTWRPSARALNGRKMAEAA